MVGAKGKNQDNAHVHVSLGRQSCGEVKQSVISDRVPLLIRSSV